MYNSVMINEVHNIEDINILDIREVEEQIYGMIPGATSFPLSNVESLISTLSKDTTYYLVCETGSRSSMAAQYLSTLGYSVINMLGGMSSYIGKKELPDKKTY